MIRETIDSAARVGAKPNSRNERIATVTGRSPGLGDEQRQVHVGEAVNERECHAGEYTPGISSGMVTWRQTDSGGAPRLAGRGFDVAAGSCAG